VNKNRNSRETAKQTSAKSQLIHMNDFSGLTNQPKGPIGSHTVVSSKLS